MVKLVQDALTAGGIEDQVLVAGQFLPRRHTGGMFVGGLIAGEAGTAVGGVAASVGTATGAVAGGRAADRLAALPAKMLVAVSPTMVYGFAAATRHTPPTELGVRVPRAGLTVKAHPRVNVRVLELIDEASGSRVQLEGNRLPVTHARDVIDALSG